MRKNWMKFILVRDHEIHVAICKIVYKAEYIATAPLGLLATRPCS